MGGRSSRYQFYADFGVRIACSSLEMELQDISGSGRLLLLRKHVLRLQLITIKEESAPRCTYGWDLDKTSVRAFLKRLHPVVGVLAVVDWSPFITGAEIVG